MSRIRAYVQQNHLSLLCLFLILGGGTAYAVDKVGSKDIKKNAVKTKHVKDGNLLAQDFAPGQLPAGPAGAPGAPGQPGTPGSGSIGANSVGSNEVIDNSLTGDDINDLSLQLQPRGTASGVASATPSAAGVSLLDFIFNSNTEVTNLTGGADGQIVTLTTINSNVDVLDGGNFRLSADWLPNTDDTLTLIRNAGTWFEIGRSAN